MSRLRGLLFVNQHEARQGIVCQVARSSRLLCAVHTLGMRFSIGILWLDASGKVVDKRLAEPWRMLFLPKSPARYTIEAAPALLDRVLIGDSLAFDKEQA